MFVVYSPRTRVGFTWKPCRDRSSRVCSAGDLAANNTLALFGESAALKAQYALTWPTSDLPLGAPPRPLTLLFSTPLSVNKHPSSPCILVSHPPQNRVSSTLNFRVSWHPIYSLASSPCRSPRAAPHMPSYSREIREIARGNRRQVPTPYISQSHRAMQLCRVAPSTPPWVGLWRGDRCPSAGPVGVGKSPLLPSGTVFSGTTCQCASRMSPTGRLYVSGTPSTSRTLIIPIDSEFDRTCGRPRVTPYFSGEGCVVVDFAKAGGAARWCGDGGYGD